MRLLNLCLLLSLNLSLFSQSFDYQKSVLLDVALQTSPPGILLSWDQEAAATSLTLYRRTPGSSNWGAPLIILSPSDTSYLDTQIDPTSTYEYRLRRNGATFTGHGYLYSGLSVPPVEQRGVLLLLVDSILAQPLETEIRRLQRDLAGDGWEVKTAVIPQNWTVAAVKDTILQLYNQAPDLTESLFLLGHIPVPYSGNINPDGHGNHIGAWPADAFYGDINGSWTDQLVNNTTASQSRNQNVPGDGKYDQSLFPSDIELGVGRVDFHSLPAFQLSEIELTRRYLEKDHAFRHGQLQVPARALIENNFANFNEGFGQNGLKNFAPLVGRDSLAYADYDELKTKSYLWSYGCGAGSYTNAGGVIGTNGLANDSIQTIFTMLFGSYFGDWDSNNNLLRAALGSGTVLANAWAGRPNWQFHPMGMGATLGECARLTQNNPNFSYDPGFGNRMVHIALMGDPSLRMHYPPSVTNLTVEGNNGHALISWNQEDSLSRFLIYRKSPGESFVRLTPQPLASSNYTDSCLRAGRTYIYQVRHSQTQITPSGAYANLSTGQFDTLIIQTDLSVNADFSILPNGLSLSLQNQSAGATTYSWDFGDGNGSNGENPQHTYAEPGNYLVTLIASNACFSDTLALEVEIVTSVNKMGAADSVLLYPNPFSDRLTVEISSPVAATVCLLLDGRGKQLGRYAFSGRLNTLDLSGLPPGPYTLQLQIGGELISRNIIKL